MSISLSSTPDLEPVTSTQAGDPHDGTRCVDTRPEPQKYEPWCGTVSEYETRPSSSLGTDVLLCVSQSTSPRRRSGRTTPTNSGTTSCPGSREGGLGQSDSRVEWSRSLDSDRLQSNLGRVGINRSAGTCSRTGGRRSPYYTFRPSLRIDMSSNFLWGCLHPFQSYLEVFPSGRVPFRPYIQGSDPMSTGVSEVPEGSGSGVPGGDGRYPVYTLLRCDSQSYLCQCPRTLES